MPDKPKDRRKDSFVGRLKKALDAKKNEGSQGGSAPPAKPPAAPPAKPGVDSYFGRLQKAIGVPPAAAAPVPPAVATVPPLTPSETQTSPADGAPAGTGPVGRGNYRVKNGDCMDSIATKHGFFWETLWNDSGNSELREVRKNSNVLLAGDRVTIPPKRRKEEPGATEQVHRFRRRGLPAKLRMRIMQDDEPRRGERYVLTVDGKVHTGALDGDGLLDVPIPPTAKKIKLKIGDDEPIDLSLGTVDPITEISGLQGRLNNLGFDAGTVDNQLTQRTQAAIRKFQQQNGLNANGRPDKATRDKLLQVHGT